MGIVVNTSILIWTSSLLGVSVNRGSTVYVIVDMVSKFHAVWTLFPYGLCTCIPCNAYDNFGLAIPRGQVYKLMRVWEHKRYLLNMETGPGLF